MHVRFTRETWLRKMKPHLAVVTPAWAEKLQKHGNYYEGIVESDEVDHILELHKRQTVISYGTRTSVALRDNPSLLLLIIRRYQYN